jgi:hypothetical protein
LKYSWLINISIFLLVLANTKAAQLTKIKPNLYDPVLSSNAYIGHIQETERIIQLEPHLYASDADPSESPNGLLLFNKSFLLKTIFVFPRQNLWL